MLYTPSIELVGCWTIREISLLCSEFWPFVNYVTLMWERYQALPTFMYCKWRKAGWSQGMRLVMSGIMVCVLAGRGGGALHKLTGNQCQKPSRIVHIVRSRPYLRSILSRPIYKVFCLISCRGAGNSRNLVHWVVKSVEISWNLRPEIRNLLGNQSRNQKSNPTHAP